MLAATLVGSVPLAGAEPEEGQAALVAKGRVTYKIYCSNCHGEKGRGDGSVAELLITKPTDLTRLGADKPFAAPEVQQAIDGRERIAAHGSSEMPIWGNVFRDTLQPTWRPESDEERVHGKISELVLYLESIQEP